MFDHENDFAGTLPGWARGKEITTYDSWLSSKVRLFDARNPTRIHYFLKANDQQGAIDYLRDAGLEKIVEIHGLMLIHSHLYMEERTVQDIQEGCRGTTESLISCTPYLFKKNRLILLREIEGAILDGLQEQIITGEATRVQDLIDKFPEDYPLKERLHKLMAHA